ncbi:hypothetical protein V497_01271 [Pseudogymnoascus sp. VKM F-4516 (FW-969)]|nr:hypothetical protein V497_01271 [Pseudogymnoascus sp. VKM F-4516 (FW-969)]
MEESKNRAAPSGTTPDPEKPHDAHDEHPEPSQAAYTNTKALHHDARAATATEHATSFWAAILTYRKAVFWSVMVSTSIIMEGYDVTLIGSFYAYPTFRKKYGADYGGDAGYQLSSAWQAGLSDIGAVGNIIGALANGYFTDIYGHRAVMLVSLTWLTAAIFIVFFAPNTPVLLVGELFCGIPWGVFATMGPAYAAEVCPLVLRGHLSAFVNLCWVIGQLLSAAVLKALVNNETQWGYRIPFALQWMFPLPLAVILYFCPDSPWWLVRANRLEEAEASLRRLSSDPKEEEVRQSVALMVHTTNLEKDMQSGATYKACFQGTNLRRTEIACMAFLSQVTNGGALVYSPVYFFEQAGIPTDASFGISLGGKGIAFVGTIISWFLLPVVGRRRIYLTGFTILVCALWLVAILACVPQFAAIKFVQASLCLVWLGAYSMTVGPIVYTIVAEIGSTQLRTKTVVLGRTTYYVGNIIGQVLEPHMMNPTEWDWKGKTAFFWGSLALLTNVWAYFRLPETKDRTYEELDIMFDKGIKARHFSRHVFRDEDEDLVREE